ncbi:N-acetylmuramoyl-L-alanine amidase family protein [Paenibacillus oenotherae]|uniref:N-acetylmuramoyl-L-alanine amidase family protein n=1 Tax=Paenibacillus oenotherae TaxID=1435645 RepID=A0ABS7D8D7_9BACL|nr:N-acetylmuramoyl-L-alanine amidase family protein [Paenibacillus oenotherae]MBW7476079.1 N-acetylmuramoyl-L-alanine amidase family protein [Paenibacillus oenotherae]
MKKFGFLLLFVALLFLLPQYGQAAPGGARILLDGQQLALPDKVEIPIISNSVMVPLRVIVENLGFDVSWDKQLRKVTVTKENRIAELTIGSATAIVDGTQQPLVTAPVIHSDTSLVPLRFISETMGLKVGWDNKTKEVTLLTPVQTLPVTEQDPTTPDGLPDSTETEPDHTDGDADPVSTGLASVDGISFDSNRLMMAITGNAAPSVFTMSNPERIVIDVPGAKFAETFGNGLLLNTSPAGALEVKDYPDVKGIRYSLFNNKPSTVRIVIDLNGATSYTTYNEGDSSSQLFVVDLNANADTTLPDPAAPTPVVPLDPNARKLVVLDAGHGGTDPGAKGITSKIEKDFNLALTLKVEALLKQQPGIDVVLTRADDTFVTLADRAIIANNLHANVFVSIHANAAPGSPSAQGTETFYYHDTSKLLADIMHKHLIAATGFKDRKAQYKSLKVLRDTIMPAALLEIGFLSNATEESLLFTEEFQQRVAASIVEGIVEYLTLPTETPPVVPQL